MCEDCHPFSLAAEGVHLRPQRKEVVVEDEICFHRLWAPVVMLLCASFSAGVLFGGEDSPAILEEREVFCGHQRFFGERDVHLYY